MDREYSLSVIADNRLVVVVLKVNVEINESVNYCKKFCTRDYVAKLKVNLTFVVDEGRGIRIHCLNCPEDITTLLSIFPTMHSDPNPTTMFFERLFPQRKQNGRWKLNNTLLEGQ